MSTRRSLEAIISDYWKGVTPTYVEKSSILVLNQKCIRNHRIDFSFAQYTDDERKYPISKFIKKGDILICSTGQGTAGRVAFVRELPKGFRVLADSHILVLRTNKIHESQCLSYCLFSMEKRLQTFLDGSTGQGEFDKVRLFNIVLGYPNDEKSQKKIASVLSALDDKIELNNRINAELEAMAKLIYEYWFVQFDFPDANGKPYKASGGKMVWNEVLKREIPEGWEVKKLSEVCEIKTDSVSPGLTPSKEFRHFSIPLFDSTGNYGLELGAEIDSHKYRVESDCLLVSKLNPWFNRVIYDTYEEDQICSTEFVVLQTRSSWVKVLLYMVATNPQFISFLTLNAVGTSNSHKRVNPKTMVDWKIPYEDSVVTQFGKICFPILEMIRKNKKQNQELAALRDWLLPMLMNGQVRVGESSNSSLMQEEKPYGEVESGNLIAAEPEVSLESSKEIQTDKIIPLQNNPFAKRVLAGKIISIFRDDPDFTHIKFQKIQFLAEHIGELDLQLNYYVQTAGPYDNRFMHSISENLKKSKWFEEVNFRFHPLSKVEQVERYFQGYFDEKANRLNRLFSLLKGKTEAETEVLATIYAVWNNRIILNQSLDVELMLKDFYSWSDRKHRFKPEEVLESIQWLDMHGFRPSGFGKPLKTKKLID